MAEMYSGPDLGNKGSEADIDTANRWMRSQPWYLDFIQSIGQNPAKVKLNDAQRQQLGMLMKENGLPVPEKDEVDPAGNINPKGHKLRNFLTAAAIGGAALTGFGLAGMGPLAGLGGAAGGAGAAGAGASGAGGAASLATPALTAGLPTGLSAGSMSAGALAGTLPGVAGAASIATPALTAGLPEGLSAGSQSIGTMAGGAGAAGGGNGILSSIGKYAKGSLGEIGAGINAATDQAAQNRMAQNDPYMQRARLDDTERATALRDLYSLNHTMNPTSSPFNPRPTAAPTGAMADTLNSLSTQNATRLKAGPTYNATTLPSLQSGTLEKVGNWAGPVLSTVGKFLK